jgi:hypothetical protein
MMPERGFDVMEIVGGKGARWTQSTGQDIGPAPLGAMYAKWLDQRHPGGYEEIYAQRRGPAYKQNHLRQICGRSVQFILASLLRVRARIT